MKELTVTSQLPIVNMNYEEVKESLTTTVEKYKGLVVTEQGLKDCKATQKELASIRTKIDTYRKSIKKEMEIPIKNFELQCKKLIGLVVEAEEPIKSGILIFDNQKKQEKAEKAEEYLIEAAKILNDYYKSKIDISDITINLSNSMKSIYEEIDSKVAALVMEQAAEEIRKQECLEVIKETLEEVNEGITTKLVKEDFTKYIDLGLGIVEIIKAINKTAEAIKRTEENIKRGMEESVALQQVRRERCNEIVEEEMAKRTEEERKKNQVAEKALGEPMLFGVIRVVDTKDRMNGLIKFLKENEYEFNIESKGSVK